AGGVFGARLSDEYRFPVRSGLELRRCKIRPSANWANNTYTFPRGDITMIEMICGSGSMFALVVGASSLQAFRPTGPDYPISAQLRPNGVMFGYFSLARTTKNHEDTKLELP